MNAYREPQIDEPPRMVRRWLPAALAVVAWAVGSRLPMPLPGVDAEAARAYVAEGHTPLATSGGQLVPLFGGALDALILVRGVLALATHGGDEARRRRWYRRGAVAFVAMVACQGFATALWLEATTTNDLLQLVPHPGLGVRLGLCALFAASGAAVWALASAITRANVAHGPVALLDVQLALTLGATLVSAGRESARDQSPLGLAGPVVALLPVVAVLLALWRWSPRSWPQRLVRGVQALSPLDLLPLPLILAAKAAAAARLAGHADDPAALIAQLVAGLAGAALVARWLRQRAPHAASRAALVATFALPLACAGAVLAGMLAHGGRVPAHLTAALDPSPRWTTVALRGDEATAALDGPRLVARQRALHHRAEVAAAHGDALRLRVAPVEGDATAIVASVLRRGDFALHRVADDQGPVSTTGPTAIDGLASRLVGVDARTWVYAGPTEASLAPVVAASEAVPGAITRVGCDALNPQHPESQCYALRLEPTPGVSNRHVASAEARTMEEDGEAYVVVTLTAEGAQAFEALTRATVRHVLAIVLDDRIHSAPVVQQPITGGTMRVTIYDGRPTPQQVAEARALAAVLSTPPLAGRWALAP